MGERARVSALDSESALQGVEVMRAMVEDAVDRIKVAKHVFFSGFGLRYNNL